MYMNIPKHLSDSAKEVKSSSKIALEGCVSARQSPSRFHSSAPHSIRIGMDRDGSGWMGMVRSGPVRSHTINNHNHNHNRRNAKGSSEGLGTCGQ
jgi:hypothetical protein